MGYIIKQARKNACLTRDALNDICSPADLVLIEEKSKGILEVILDLCMKLEIPIIRFFQKKFF
ncbi:hypothetical protein IGI38_002176 [Enterococcus sp. AZ128]